MDYKNPEAHKLMPGDFIRFCSIPARTGSTHLDEAALDLWDEKHWIAERRGTSARLEGVEGWFEVPCMILEPRSSPWPPPPPPERPKPKPPKIRKLDGSVNGTTDMKKEQESMAAFLEESKKAKGGITDAMHSWIANRYDRN